MSLDIYLIGEESESTCVCNYCGNEHKKVSEDVLYETNITHNLGKMADAAGIYYALWQPEEIAKTKAGELIELLENGLKELHSKPELYKTFNASNGWGTYDQFVPWVEKYLDACKKYPESIINVSR